MQLGSITKRDIQMFHDESWKPIHFGSKVRGHNVCVGLQTQRNITAAVYVSHGWLSLL